MNKSLLKAVAERVRAEPHLFDMGKWGVNESCETTRCICGWAVLLAEGGYQEEEKVESYSRAGRRVLDITEEQAASLFYFDRWPEPFFSRFCLALEQDSQAEAEVAYDRILHFIRTGE